MNLAMVVVAAGDGARFGGDKLAEMLASRTVLETSLAALTRAFPDVPMVVVVPSDRVDFWIGRLAESHPDCKVISGGSLRQESVKIGVQAVSASGSDVVAIHDAARPLVDPQDVKGVVLALGDSPGAILSVPVADTVKRVGSDGMVVDTVSREMLRLAQTPQVFRVEALETAWRKVDAEERWTDESMLLERAGFPIRSVVAQHPNPKLTSSADLKLLRALQGSSS